MLAKLWYPLILVVSVSSGCGQSTTSEPETPMSQEQPPTIALPKPDTEGKTPLERTIRERRSVRSFADAPLTLAQVSQLVWAAQGITDKATGFRTIPSAGALFPLELYVVAGKVEGLEAGMYKYLPKDHALKRVLTGDMRAGLCRGALSQEAIREAPVSLVIVGIHARTSVKYGRRAERFVAMEAGHAGQNIALQAVALGLGSVCIGGYDDGEVQKALLLPDEEVPLYIIPVGVKK